MQKDKDFFYNNQIVNEYNLNNYIETASVDYINNTINDENFKHFFSTF